MKKTRWVESVAVDANEFNTLAVYYLVGRGGPVWSNYGAYQPVGRAGVS